MRRNEGIKERAKSRGKRAILTKSVRISFGKKGLILALCPFVAMGSGLGFTGKKEAKKGKFWS